MKLTLKDPAMPKLTILRLRSNRSSTKRPVRRLTSSRPVRRLTSSVTLVAVTALFAGCGFELPEEVLLPEIQPTDNVAQSPDPSITTVTIRFRNLAVTEAVNVEFFATNNPLTLIPDDLFVDENLVTSSIGVAGTGILEPLREDTLNFPCTSDLVLGTFGGSFLDNETGDPLGVGQPRWAQDSSLGLCGREVLLEFGRFSGEFGVRISIDD